MEKRHHSVKPHTSRAAQDLNKTNVRQLPGRVLGQNTPQTTETTEPLSQDPATDGTDVDISDSDSDDEWPRRSRDVSVSANPEVENGFTNPDAAQYDLFAGQPPPQLQQRQNLSLAPLGQPEKQPVPVDRNVHHEQHGKDQGNITEKQPVLPDTLSDYLLLFGWTREAAREYSEIDPSNDSP